MSTARLGGRIGLAMGAVYAAWLLAEETGPTGAGALPAAGVGLGYVAPFAAGLIALRVRDAGRRAGIWLGCGVLGLVLSLTSVTGVTLPLVLPAAMLLVAGARELRAAGDSRHGADLGVLIGIVALGTTSVVIARVSADAFGAVVAIAGWAMVAAWLAAMLSMDRRRDLGVRP